MGNEPKKRHMRRSREFKSLMEKAKKEKEEGDNNPSKSENLTEPENQILGPEFPDPKEKEVFAFTEKEKVEKVDLPEDEPFEEERKLIEEPVMKPVTRKPGSKILVICKKAIKFQYGLVEITMTPGERYEVDRQLYDILLKGKNIFPDASVK